MRFTPRLRLALLLAGVGASAAAAQSNPLPGLVNITDTRFASGCPGAADPTGHRDSTCAIRAAFSFAEGSGLPGAGYPVLYFPHGIYKVAGEGYTSALTLTKAVSIQGDGAPNTVLLNTSPHGATLTYLSAQECSGKPGMCPITVQGMTFAGQGHATAGGLIEIDSTNTGSMRNVVLSGTAGVALNLQGSSERWYFSDMEIQDARWPVLTEGDTNENYFDRVNVLDGGETGDYCYSINCPGGKLIESGTWRERVDRVLVVDCDEERQIERVMRRNGFTRGQVVAIIAQQSARAERLAAAHDVIINDDDAPAAALQQVDQLHQQYLKLSENARNAKRVAKTSPKH